MRFGENGPWRRRPAAPAWRWLGVTLCLLSGCAGTRSHVAQAVKTDRGGPAKVKPFPPSTQSAPDVVGIRVDDHPDLAGEAAIGLDGRLGLERLGRPRVEGQTAQEVTQTVATAVGVDPEAVHVRVVAYSSQQIYLFGEVFGLHRAVPYQGPETVLDLLQRVGGVTAGAAPGDIYVIRSHVADGHDPEMFHIDLQAITLKKDDSTNVRLQPFDQVYVGQTRQAVIDRCMPPWLRPAYQRLTGMKRQP